MCFVDMTSLQVMAVPSNFAAIFEGKLAIFRAIITGNPNPDVTWVRSNGDIGEERYKPVFDAMSGEHQLQVYSLSVIYV